MLAFLPVTNSVKTHTTKKVTIAKDKKRTEFVDVNIVIKNIFLLTPTFLMLTQVSPNGDRFWIDRKATLK